MHILIYVSWSTCASVSWIKHLEIPFGLRLVLSHLLSFGLFFSLYIFSIPLFLLLSALGCFALDIFSKQHLAAFKKYNYRF